MLKLLKFGRRPTPLVAEAKVGPPTAAEQLDVRRLVDVEAIRKHMINYDLATRERCRDAMMRALHEELAKIKAEREARKADQP